MLRIKTEGVVFTDGQLAQLGGKLSRPLCNIAEVMVDRPVASEHGRANKHLTTRSRLTAYSRSLNSNVRPHKEGKFRAQSRQGHIHSYKSCGRI